MKMRTLFRYLIPAAVAVFALASCTDNRNEHLDEFATIAYFRNGGDQDLSIYRTGDPYIYAIPVCKAGSDRSGSIEVEVVPFSEGQMSAYNIKYQTEYELIPQSLFKFVSSDDPSTATALPDQKKVILSFGPEDFDHLVYLSLDVNGISALMEDNPEIEYRLALQLFSDGQLSKGINIIMLTPTVDVPKVRFTTSGFENKIFDKKAIQENKAAPDQKFSNSITLNMEKNDWSFDCELEVKDQDWLDAYNMAHGTDYVVMPGSCYSFNTKTAHFEKGKLVSGFDVNVTTKPAEGEAQFEALLEYVIPIVIKSCSKKEFVVDDQPYMIHARINPDEVLLSGDMITVSANESGDGGGASALVDGKADTYWHSPWSSYVSNPDPDYGIYVDIALKSPLRRFALNYRTRSGNANGVPVASALGVSTDGENWVKFVDIDLGVLEGSAAAGTWVSLPAVKSAESFSYIRFGITAAKSGILTQKYARGSQPFVSISEIQLYGVN